VPWKIDFFKIKISLENKNILGNCLKNRNSSEISLEKSKFFVKLPEKNEIFRKFSLKNRFFCLWNCPKESKFFGNFPRKSNFFYPGPRHPRFQTRLMPLKYTKLISGFVTKCAYFLHEFIFNIFVKKFLRSFCFLIELKKMFKMSSCLHASPEALPP